MTADSQLVWKKCIELGWSVDRLPGWRVPDHILNNNKKVIIYGEPLLAEAVCDQLGLVLLEPSIDWLTKVPEKYLSRTIQLMSLGEARLLDTRAFVKPAEGKIFEPTVYEKGDALPTDRNVDLETPVLRSEVVDFRLEVRCFVRERSIVTLSPYWRNDQLASDEFGNWPFLENEEAEAKIFAQSVLDDNDVPFPPACTLDVGKLTDGKWAIIEANPCWGAGLYGCDPEQVLLSIGSTIIAKSSATTEDKLWISKRRQEIHK